MRRISIIAKNDGLAQGIVTALPENVCCKILASTEIVFNPGGEDCTPPDMLIIDLASTGQVAKRFFARLNYHYPEIIIIVLAPTPRAGSMQDWTTLDVDDILARPENEEQSRYLMERLLAHLSHCDHLQMIQERLRQQMNRSQIIARSKPMREIIQQLPKFAAYTSTVLITGETGTGKELFARAIHYLGPRAGQPFITVDCGAMPDHLVENELFGHVRGAYTDANTCSKGLIQEADGGTLFLDEVEALPLGVQAKFLRFLQERQYKPLGQSKYVSVNVRVLAATNVDLVQALAKKNFREDLYYRLNVLPLLIPPLRTRKADIPALAYAFLQQHERNLRPATRIPDDTLRRWMEYDWPGNVRELENKVQQWLTEAPPDDQREANHLFNPKKETIRDLAEARRDAVTQFEREYLSNLLTHTHGNISAAARLAGTDRKHIRALLRKNAIVASHFQR